MCLCISNVLSSAESAEFRAGFSSLQFTDGRRTSGTQASSVKRNLQLDPNQPFHRKASARIYEALTDCDLFNAASLPKAISPILFNRYTEGMFYGSHVDNALMGSPCLRTDLSFTLFLSDPNEYEGGELVIEDALADTPIKLSAGALVLYPSTFLHHVAEVRAGVRYAAVGWVQSYVPLAEHRQILFQLYQCRRSLDDSAVSDVARTLGLVQSNLTRLWALA